MQNNKIKKGIKRVLTFVSVLFLWVCSCFLVGCNNAKEEEQPHTHSITKTDAKTPTCTETGYEEYYSCDTCGKLFADVNATEEIYVIPALEKIEHSYTNENATAAYLASEATCEAKATYFKSCVCGAKGTDTFSFGEVKMHTYSEEVAEQAYLASEATCETKATYYKSCACGVKGTETFTYGEFGSHVYNEEFPTQAYLASDATCVAKASYYKSCACGERGTDTFTYGDFGGHGKGDLIVSDNALVDSSTDSYFLSCPHCGQLSTETTTVAEFLGIENGMSFTQFQGFDVELPKNTTLTIEKYTVKLMDGTVKAEYTGGAMDDFYAAFNALSPKFVYLLEYVVSNGDDTDVYEGVVDFSINTVDTVSIAQTESGVDNLHAKGSSAELFYVEGNIGGRKGAYEWTSGATTSGTNKTTITLIRNSLTQNSALAGRYLYFDFYATRDFAPAFTHNGDTYYLYSKTYDNIRMFNSQGNLITTRSQSLWNNKWVTIEICLEVNYEFDNNWRGFMTASATGNYGLVNTDNDHMYLDNFRISTYSIYGEIEGVNECVTHTFNAKVPQPKYLSQNSLSKLLLFAIA